MFTRFPSWMGPIAVEWTPDQPALAQERRKTVLATMQRAGQPIGGERVVVIPSPYPGGVGTEAANNYANTILRGASAPAAYPLPPTESASTGVH
jgi:hypothetical protein